MKLLKSNQMVFTDDEDERKFASLTKSHVMASYEEVGVEEQDCGSVFYIYQALGAVLTPTQLMNVCSAASSYNRAVIDMESFYRSKSELMPLRYGMSEAKLNPVDFFSALSGLDIASVVKLYQCAVDDGVYKIKSLLSEEEDGPNDCVQEPQCDTVRIGDGIVDHGHCYLRAFKDNVKGIVARQILTSPRWNDVFSYDISYYDIDKWSSLRVSHVTRDVYHLDYDGEYPFIDFVAHYLRCRPNLITALDDYRSDVIIDCPYLHDRASVGMRDHASVRVGVAKLRPENVVLALTQATNVVDITPAKPQRLFIQSSRVVPGFTGGTVFDYKLPANSPRFILLPTAVSFMAANGTLVGSNVHPTVVYVSGNEFSLYTALDTQIVHLTGFRNLTPEYMDKHFPITAFQFDFLPAALRVIFHNCTVPTAGDDNVPVVVFAPVISRLLDYHKKKGVPYEGFESDTSLMVSNSVGPAIRPVVLLEHDCLLLTGGVDSKKGMFTVSSFSRLTDSSSLYLSTCSVPCPISIIAMHKLEYVFSAKVVVPRGGLILVNARAPKL